MNLLKDIETVNQHTEVKEILLELIHLKEVEAIREQRGEVHRKGILQEQKQEDQRVNLKGHTKVQGQKVHIEVVISQEDRVVLLQGQEAATHPQDQEAILHQEVVVVLQDQVLADQVLRDQVQAQEVAQEVAQAEVHSKEDRICFHNKYIGNEFNRPFPFFKINVNQLQINNKINTMKKYILIIVFLLPIVVFSQSLEDALRYSYADNIATARSLGVGGSFGAMGADFSAISHNPATLGNFWRSEFNISLGHSGGYANAYWSKNNDNSLDSKFVFDNIGFVTNNKKSGTWVSRNFAIGLNKIAEFSNRMDVDAVTNGSLMESPDLFDQSNIDYEPFYSFPINQSMNTTESGSINEMVFALGGNYKKKMLFGVSIGVPFLTYNTERHIEESLDESLIDDPDFYFTSLTYDEIYSTTGVGFNLKLGAIAILPRNFRVGVSMHTPTGFRLSEDASKDFVAESNNYYIDTIAQSSYFDFKLTTPWKFIGSVGKIFKSGKLAGFVNADAEFLNYSSGKYNFRKYSSDPIDLENEKLVNRKIRRGLRSTVNFKLGMEIGYQKLRFRLGGSLNGSPFVDSEGFDPSKKYSFGLGYRGDNYYIDLGYLGSDYSYSYSPYVTENTDRTPQIAVDKHTNRLVATVGFKF